jgi:hypothetical protein
VADQGTAANGSASEATPVAGAATSGANPPSGLSLPPLTIVSIVLLLAGVGLFALGLVARGVV